MSNRLFWEVGRVLGLGAPIIHLLDPGAMDEAHALTGLVIAFVCTLGVHAERRA